MLTNLGKKLRRYRIDKGLLLFDMARDLNIGCAKLSGVETGRRPASKELIEQMRRTYPQIDLTESD